MPEDKAKEICGKLEVFLDKFEARLAECGKGYVSSDKMSIGDIRVFAGMSIFAFNPAMSTPMIGEHMRNAIKSRKCLNAWSEKMQDTFKGYLDSRPPRPF